MFKNWKIFLFVLLLITNAANSQNQKYDFWRIDGALRGANVHPYKHFSSYSMREPISLQDIMELKNLGANLLVANYPGVFTYFSPYEIDSLHLMNLDSIVSYSRECRLNLVISLRSGPGRSLQVFDNDGREDELLFHDSFAMGKYIEMCEFIADRYKKNDHIIGYNFILEPHADYPVYLPPVFDSTYFKFVDELISRIRKVDSVTPIIIQPLGWAYPDRFFSMKVLNDPFLVYSCNMYFPHQFTNELNDSVYPGSYYYRDSLVQIDSSIFKDLFYNVIQFKKVNDVPIFINEYGGRRFKKGFLNYLKDLHSLFISEGFHFAFYIWKSEWGDVNGESFGDYNYLKGPDGNSINENHENELMDEFKRIWFKE
ncbi:MAG: glycoside hydrolase family 5 protein [Ignavibacteria bacterium]|nr:glycoside hydrolase family 5 protein [Ignavibacteria bacterium]